MYELLHWFSPQAHLSQNSEWTLGENKHRVSTCCLPAFKHSQGRLCDYLISSLFSTSSKVLPSFLVFPQTPQSIRFFEEYCHWPTWVAWRTSSLGLFLQGSFDISHSCIRREGEKPSPFHCSPDLSVLYVSSYILPITSLQNKDPWLFHVWCSLSTAWTSQCMSDHPCHLWIFFGSSMFSPRWNFMQHSSVQTLDFLCTTRTSTAA